MEVVNGFYYFDVFLIETYKNLGQYDLITNNEIIGTLTTITFTQNTVQSNQQSVPFNINVSGITKSRLTEVRSFDPNVPYKAGINGVLFVTTEYVEYSIGDVIYKTFLDTQLTTFFKVTKPTNELQSQSIIGNDNSVSIDIKKTLNAMVIDRSNISIYEYFNKINNCNELDDLLEIF
jgi:hypothetical protein